MPPCASTVCPAMQRPSPKPLAVRPVRAAGEGLEHPGRDGFAAIGDGQLEPAAFRQRRKSHRPICRAICQRGAEQAGNELRHSPPIAGNWCVEAEGGLDHPPGPAHLQLRDDFSEAFFDHNVFPVEQKPVAGGGSGRGPQGRRSARPPVRRSPAPCRPAKRPVVPPRLTQQPHAAFDGGERVTQAAPKIVMNRYRNAAIRCASVRVASLSDTRSNAVRCCPMRSANISNMAISSGSFSRRGPRPMAQSLSKKLLSTRRIGTAM
jgi:hypothetical protein